MQVTVQETPREVLSQIEAPADELAAYFETEEWEAAKADTVSLEEVRRALSSIPGSLADAVIDSRDDRC